jgi:hypothetical protein
MARTKQPKSQKELLRMQFSISLSKLKDKVLIIKWLSMLTFLELMKEKYSLR